ncbi:MAG: glycosyltransferase [Candidatus Krumholzibacteriia bacterium]
MSEPSQDPAPLRHPLRLCIVINPGFALRVCYRGQYGYLLAQGYRLTAVAGPGPEDHAELRRLGVETHVIRMARYPHLLLDTLALVRLWWFFLRHRFEVIQVSTPKASLLGALAARLAGQRRIIYLVRGRPYETMAGWRRRLYAASDRFCCSLAAIVVPVSRSLASSLAAEGICDSAKLRLVGAGSSMGVDLERFRPTGARARQAAALRGELGLPRDAQVVLFVGWLRREKGVEELVRACTQLRRTLPGTHLVLMGDPHRPDDLSPDTWSMIGREPWIHRLDWRHDTAPVYHLADIVVLPSWREGFPRVVLEAGAAGKPVVTTDAAGCRDAVVPGITGRIVPVRDADGLALAMQELLADRSLRERQGAAAYGRICEEFTQERIWAGHDRLFREVAAGPGGGKA